MTTTTIRRTRPGIAYTQVPFWVTLSGASSKALALYNVLAMLSDGDGIVLTHLTPVAHLLGFARADKLQPYTRELIDAGAIVVLAGPNRAGFRAIVRFAPPEDYTGPRTFEEWLARRDEQLAGAR